MIGSSNINYLRFLITGDSSQLQAEVEKSKRTVTGMVDGMAGSLGRLGTLLGGVFAGVSVTAFVGKLVSVQREFDVLNSSLVTVTGSAQAAGREMAWIKTFAKDTPYGLAQATEAFVKMKALGLDPTQAKLTSFGNTAAGMGKSLMQMIEAVADAATGEFERLKEFGIKASKQGDMVAFTFQGVTTRVKNSAKDITDYLENIGNTAFGGAMEQRAKTLDGAIAALGDSWDELFRTINESTGFSEKAAGGVRLVTDAIDGLGKMVENHQGVVMTFLGAAGGAAAAAGLVAVAGAIGVVKGAIVTLAAVLAANPVTLALLGVGVVAGAGVAAVNMYAKTAAGIEDAIATLRVENERSEAAMARAVAGGRAAGADNIAKTIEARKDQIAKLRAELDMLNASSKGAGGGRGSINPPTAAETAAKKAQEDADAEQTLLEIRQKLYGVNKDYLPQLQKLNELRQAGRITEAAYVDLVSKLAKENYKEDESAKARAASAKQLHTAYGNLVDSIEEKIAAQRLEISGGEKLGEADKLRIKYSQDLLGSLKGLNAGERANIEAKLKTLKTLEKENEAKQKALKLAEEERKYRQEWMTTQGKTVEELTASNQALRDEIELIGLSAEQQRVVIEQRQMAIILSKEQQLAEMERSAALTGTMTMEHALLQQEIELLRERLGLTSVKASREASAEAAKASTSEWQKGVDQIGQSLADQLMQGGLSFGQYLKNLARTLIFKPLIQATVQIAGGALGSLFGAPAAAGQSGGAGMGMLNNLGMFGAGAQALWGFLPGASAASLAGANAVGLAGGDALGALIAGNGSWAGVGSSFGSLMSGLGAALPWLAGGLAIFSLLKGGLFGSRGPNHSGGVYSTRTDDWDTAANQALGKDAWGNALGDFTKRGNKELGKQVGTTVDALIDVYKSLAKFAGGTAKDIDIAAGFATNPKYGDESAHGYFQILDKATGEVLSSYKNRDLGKDPEKAFAQFVADMGGSLIDQIKKADIPSWMRNVFDDMDEEITLESFNAALQTVELTGAAIEGWTRNITNFGKLGDEAIAKLIKSAGGIQDLITGMDAFYTSFYSERERIENAANALDKALADLKIDIDPRMGQDAKAKFKKLIEDAMAAGDVELLAKLIPLAKEFGAVADAAGQVLDTLKNERRQLEAEYLRATGQTDKYREALRRLATEGMSEAERAAWDYNQALREEIARLDQRTDLERKLLELQGNTAELRRRELAALDPSNRALQERIWAIEDEKAAQAAAYDMFRRAVDRDREALQQQVSVVQEVINTISSSVGVLNSAAAELYGTVDSTSQWAAARGMVYVEQALAGVRSGRKLSEYGDLGGAVQATRAGLASGVYATDFERRRDALVWAGKFSELGELGESQLSIEERSLKALQAQIEGLDTLNKRAEELVNGTVELAETVQVYFERLIAGLFKSDDSTKPGGGKGGGVVPSWGSGGGGFATVDSKYKKPTAILSGGTVLYENASSEQEKKLDGLSGIFHSFDGTGDFVGLSNAIRNAGGTASDLAFLYGFSESDVLAAMDRNGIPRFEDGGLHAGGLRLVGERGWEIEATGPARYWNQEQLGRAMAGSGAGADFGLLAASIDRLEQRLGQLEMQMARTANNTAKLPEFAEQFDAVTGGGQMMRTGAGGRT
ncbi:tape measure protein [Delftia sp. DT-2]|uniref:tape measure protein n=1 Tax=Delftia sp. DT-2 TaxID=3022772 RepID=UPI00233F2560|nr:tape measure protein [Delftia sp. DT-2]MDC2858587.1 tape measure protein [Delftia sp. DT-2]